MGSNITAFYHAIFPEWHSELKLLSAESESEFGLWQLTSDSQGFYNLRYVLNHVYVYTDTAARKAAHKELLNTVSSWRRR
jgi:hypothetical protein